MSSIPSIPPGNGLIPLELVPMIYALFKILTQKRKRRRISTKFRRFNRRKTTINLNMCKPLLRSSYSKRIPKDNEQKNVEDLIIIWLDQNINKMDENASQRKVHLRQIINCLETFDNVDECLRYIKDINEEKIFLIMSGSLGKTIINEVNNYSQVYSIYIYCSNECEHKTWAKNYSKIVEIFTDEHQLITQITKDVSSYFHNDISINIINSVDTSQRSTQDLTKDEAKFMWSQMLIDILVNLPKTSQSKNELIQECRRHYHNNSYQQNKITEFENSYNSSNALLWYTKDSFLYRIVNKALRTQNILYIYKCRFFIIDLSQQLTEIHQKFLETTKEKTITVYRGQLMPADEFDKLKNNINGFISINTFFSTSHSSTVPFNFAGDGSRRPMFESVYFEIELDFSINYVKFVDLNTISQFKSENELLLCLGTIFRIETVEPLNDFLWYCKLVLANQNETTKLNNLKEYLIKANHDVSNYLALGKILQIMGQYDKAQTYYKLLLKEFPSNHPDIPAIYGSLGTAIASMQINSKLAMNYLRRSLILQIKTFSNHILLFTQTLNSIACIYVQYRKFKFGLVFYKCILKILDYILVGPDTPQILQARIDICNNIGYIYSIIGQLSKSLKYYQISLIDERKILPSNHPDIALSLNNIGLIYLKKLDLETAEKYLQEANSIRQESLPFEYHPDLAQMYNNLGMVQYYQRNFDNALIHFEKALEIQLKCLPPIHPHTAMLYNSIGNIYLEKKDYQMALQMYQESLEISQQCFPSFHPQISELHQNIGSIYRSVGYYDKALTSCHKALQIGLKCLSPMHSDLAEIYQDIGRIYCETDNHVMAITKFQKAIDIYTKNPPINQQSLGTLYHELGREYYAQENYQDALRYFQKALEIDVNCKEEESSLVILYYNLGQAYYDNGEYDNALLYYNKCLDIEMSSISISNFENLSRTYNAIGETSQALNNYQMALTNYQKALETILKDDSTSKSTDYFNSIETYKKNIQVVNALL